uniref:FUS-interacting serine-arginine-rich protein 1 n=1 Tax=Tetraselmis sp. GSL018 TaxID=582737 RepID=A0A061RGN7_9CHLO
MVRDDYGREEPTRTSILLRNLSRSTRTEDIRYLSEKYGPVRDVYLPLDYYTKEPRGIGFVEFVDTRDAEDARRGFDRRVIDGREVVAVFAEQGRKKPQDYRRGGGGGSRYSDRPRGDDRPRGGRERDYGFDRDYRRRRSYRSKIKLCVVVV